VLSALSGAQGRQNAASFHSSGFLPGALRLVAHAAPHGSRQGLCRLWSGLRLRSACLVAGGGWSSADPSRPCGRGGGPGGDGGSYGRWSAVLNGAKTPLLTEKPIAPQWICAKESDLNVTTSCWAQVFTSVSSVSVA